jgi:predicted lipase
MASLCADWLDDDGTYSDPIVYTYGSPRVGDIPFSNDYAPKHYRFVNSGDVITRIPPPAILEGVLVKMYHHCGIQAYMGSTGLVLGGDLPIQLLSADQHHLYNYIAAIQALIAAQH